MAKITDVYNVLFNVNDKKYKEGMKRVESQTKKTTSRMGGFIQKLGGVKVALLAATAAMGAFIKSSISAYRTQEKAERQLEAATVASTKMSKAAAADIKRWAAELQRTTTVGDETSLMVARVGIAIGNLGKNQIKPFMQLSADLAAATGKNVSRVSRTLAAALADPIRGLTTLQTQGLQVDDAFKEQIKTMVESGRIMEAQTLIMERFGKGVKGQAASLRSGAGAFDVLRNSLGDMMEAIGKLATKVLAPLALQLNKVVRGITRLIEMIPGGRGKDEELKGKSFTDRLLARDKESVRKGKYVTVTDMWGTRKVWVPEEAADKVEADESAAQEEAAEINARKEHDMVSREIARFNSRRERLGKYGKIEQQIEDRKIKALNAATAGRFKLAEEYRRQELELEKELNKAKLEDQKKTDRERIRENFKALNIIYRNNSKFQKLIAAKNKAELIRDLIIRVKADAAKAFGATTAKGGFWAIPLAWTSFALTAATLGSALANIRNYHTGGLVTQPPNIPGSNDEVMAVLQRGEKVIPRDQVDNPPIPEPMEPVQIELVGDAGKLLQVVTEDRINEGF